MTCVMPMLVNKGSTSTKEERKTMVDTFLCGASKNTRRIIIKFMTMTNSMRTGRRRAGSLGSPDHPQDIPVEFKCASVEQHIFSLEIMTNIE